MCLRPDIDAIRARAAAATPGPWEWDQYWALRTFASKDDDAHSVVIVLDPENDPYEDSDRLFISNARKDIPALLDYIAELEKEGTC